MRINNTIAELDKSLNYTRHLTLEYKDNFFSIGFSALNFSNPELNQYKYILEGFDKNWFEPEPGQHTASYTNVREGTYNFKVKAANNDGVWNEEGARLQITVLPPWYRTWWFRLLAGLFVIGVIYALFQYRLQQLLRIERLRVQISSDLHDEVGGLLSGVAMQAELMGIMNGEADKKHLNKISTSSRDALSIMRDVVWAIDSRKDNVGELFTRIKEFAGEVLTPKDIRYYFEINGLNFQKNIPLDLRKNLFLISKEAITNIVRHSNATEMYFTAKNKENIFEMTIRDNGTQLDKTVKRTGQGLGNIQMRADKIGAALTISRENGFEISIKTKAI